MTTHSVVPAPAALALLICAACSGGGDKDASLPAAGDAAAQDGGAGTDGGSPPDNGAGDTGGGGDGTAIGGWRVTVDNAAGLWKVRSPDGRDNVLSGPVGCRGGLPPWRSATGEPSVKNQSGAFQINLDTRRVEWKAPPCDGVPAVESGTDKLAIRHAGHGAIEFSLDAKGGLKIGLAPEGTARGGELRLDCQTAEGFSGLGTQVTGMDLRGRKYPLWTQEQGISKPENGGIFPLNNIPEAAYAPAGVWHSTRGYSALMDHDGYSEIDLCKAEPGGVTLRSWGDQPRFVLLQGASLRQRVTALSEYTGRPATPPDWVFAPWNDAVGGPERVRAVAKELRDNQIPSSAIWSEDWIGGEQTATGFRLSYAWEWDPKQYPDLPQLIDELHAQGFAFFAYFNPFVPQPTRMYKEGSDGGFLMKTSNGGVYNITDPAFRQAGQVDLSNPAAVQWLKGYLRRAAKDLKIDGWMADFAEWMPVDAVLASKEDPWLAHNRYPLDWQRINREVFEEVHAAADGARPANDWTFYSRSGWASTKGGMGRTAPVLWAGDQNTDWDYDDGFPTILPIGAHSGLSGMPVYATDIAGYTSIQSPNTTKELFFRWASMGAFHPVMRTHHGSDKCGNWVFDADAETLAHFRRYAILHTLLLPYLKSVMNEAVEQGLPMQRHPVLVFEDKPALWSGDQYQVFLGDALLIAPVLKEGGTSRPVTLPGAGWWPLLGAAPAAGGETLPDGALRITASLPPTEIGVYAAPGTVLPLLAEPVDSHYGASKPGVKDLTSVKGRYRLALYPAPDGALKQNRVGEAVISGSGWPQTTVDWTSATVDGAAVKACGGPSPQLPCADGGLLRIKGAKFTIKTGAATLQADGAAEQEYAIGLGGAAFGEWRNPTPLTNLKPDIKLPCEK
ncbi:MAG: hypothetical protein GMKNLPBB_03253 [Myxococcota bacterium]|nr:hypothetical protein [Myxococcota bacterium]